MHKYRAKPTEVDGIKFDSRGESHRYADLKLLLHAKKIQNLQLQVPFELQPAFTRNGKKYQSIKLVVDFLYFDVERNKMIAEDFKGYQTYDSTIKHKMFAYHYPEYELELVRR